MQMQAGRKSGECSQNWIGISTAHVETIRTVRTSVRAEVCVRKVRVRLGGWTVARSQKLPIGEHGEHGEHGW